MTPLPEAMVLCAGLGTRLRPLTFERAKPAVPLLGRPLAGYALALAKALGATRAVINTHWLPDTMRAAAQGEAERLGLALGVSHEPALLGTGGGLRQVRDRGLVARDRPLLVLNGDVLFDVDLERVVAAHARSGALATMVLRRMPEGATYSPVEADAEGRIHRIGRWGTPGRGAPSLFTGIHLLSPEALDLLPGGESGVVEQVYARLLANGARVQAAFDEGLWLDLGDPPGYLDAHLALLDGRGPLGPLARHGILSLPVDGVSDGARVDPSATVSRSSIAESAEIGAGAHVTDSVLWEGARIGPGERVHRTIVTPLVRVAVP